MKKTLLALAFTAISIQAATAADVASTPAKPPSAAERLHPGAATSAAAKDNAARQGKGGAGEVHKSTDPASPAQQSKEPPRQEPPKQEPPKQEPPRQEPPRQEPPRQEPPRQEPPRHAPDATPATPSVGSSVKPDASPSHPAQSQAPPRTGKK